MMDFSNAEVAKKLREVAAAYTLKRANLFQIRAYETAADGIEHSTSEVHDLWEEGKLDQLPGIGENLQAHLDELFKTGKVKHWEEVKKGIPQIVFDLLDIPGIGPKTAYKISTFGVKNLVDLQDKLKSNQLIKKGLSSKLAAKIVVGVKQRAAVKGGRVLLPYAFTQAQKILNYLKENPLVLKADVLGSLRRMVATVGDLDFAVATNEPKKVVEYISLMPGVKRVLGKGETKIDVIISSGLELDFLMAKLQTYGALLQHFSGSKHHNIHLRTLAERKGFSLSEYGMKDIKTGKVQPTATEEELYGLLGMQTPPPELREDSGEIEAALKHELPQLIELKDIKGDLHIHSNFPIEPSHDLGANSVKELVDKAQDLGYEYLGISDHSPSLSNHAPESIINLVEKRKNYIEEINYSQDNIRILNLLEIDILPSGELSVPDEGLKLLDFALAGVHSSHHQPKEQMTKRILKALANPYVKVLTHPTNRLLNERDSSDADWETIFKFAAANKKAMEISAFPNRLDLPDTLVRMAKSFGVKFVIDTDSHEKSQMELMRFGVAVARRGWLTKEDVVNSWDWTKFAKWFNLK